MKSLVQAPWFGHAVVIAAMIAAIGIVNVAWVAPREKERAVLGTQEASLRDELEDLQAGIAEMELWRRGQADLAMAAGKAKRALPAGSMVSSLLDALAEVGKRHGVRADLNQPAGLPSEETIPDAAGAAVTYRKVDLRLRLEAPYRQVGQYLSDVEKLDQLVVIRSVTLRHEAALAPRLIADVSLWIYGTP
jgi:Tfp pilus assembly protein PilO